MVVKHGDLPMVESVKSHLQQIPAFALKSRPTVGTFPEK